MTTKKKTTNGHKQPVLVTTQHRGVFFGYLDGDPSKERTRLTDSRNVVFWSTDVRGFMGLAAGGPTKGCRVGPSVPRVTLFDVTSVVECSEDAAKRFEDAPWSN